MLKQLFLFFSFTFTHILFAQQKDQRLEKYQLYIEKNSTPNTQDQSAANDNACFITLVSVDKKKQLQHSKLWTIMRKLDDSVYIICPSNKKFFPAFDSIFSFLVKANSLWKLSPTLLLQYSSGKISFPSTFVYYSSTNRLIEKDVKKNSRKIAENSFLFTAQTSKNLYQLLQEGEVNFISNYQQPKEELQINDLDLSANKINVLHSKLPSLNGEGLVISIKENLPDTTDIDFAGRYFRNQLSPIVSNPHSTIMSTIAAGGGNSWHLGKGVAWGSAITSSDFSNLFPDTITNYLQNNITVQNHSYGVGIENFYGADAAAFDATTNANNQLVFVFSAGNKGDFPSPTGNYTAVNNVANLTGSFKMAKNIITVGATDSFGITPASSSRGPAYDGRIKPEMVAYGKDGTSGAAALVSGTVLVLQQAYKTATGSIPPSSLVKAVLLNSADDVGAAGIDFVSGYGSLNAYKAARTVLSGKYFNGTVSLGATQPFSISVPPNCSKLKVTLVWNDVAAIPNALHALVNDLDIELVFATTGERWLPWTLNSFPHRDSLLLPAKRKRDSLNNVEQISIENPAAGSYTILIKGYDIIGSTQQYSIAWQVDSSNNFEWEYPTNKDFIFSNGYNTIRWNNNFPVATGRLEYSIDNGFSWLLIDDNIRLSKKYYYWNAPDTSAVALLKMTASAQSFVCDTFTISGRTNLKVGYNCSDSTLLFWNKSKGISNYNLYGLGNKYLQLIRSVNDTQIVFAKNNFAFTHLAVEPAIANRASVKSYTTNFNEQGTSCYINNFLADLVNENQAHLQLIIGTTYQIKKIQVEKLQADYFSLLIQFDPTNNLQYDATDISLQKGENRYRIKIILLSGQIIYSDIQSVFYFKGEEVIVYPTPVAQFATINIQLKELQNQLLQIIDFSGRKVFEQTATATLVLLPARFSTGIYYLRITNPETKSVKNFRLLIL